MNKEGQRNATKSFRNKEWGTKKIQEELMGTLGGDASERFPIKI
jgi:hypothetical protein